ncbi:MAG: tRNA 2-selenouridine(34) synthase MnmH [Parachlamydia sp.]|nr:tRNA 2-selenouridine(34) synthase MnmH [Parachlamydia sp.]
MKTLDPLDFIKSPGIIFDVRSPGEYAQGHLPGAQSMPLFSDSERAIVGTLYKQKGRNVAVEQGLRIVGPKMADFVDFVKDKLEGEKLAKIHCWLGGMRSGSVAWLLETAGIATATLEGGYKRFRRYVLELISSPYPLLVIGGLTGSGKSNILGSLKTYGEQVLDLEQLACHRGSTYGHLNMPPQPTIEHFENKIAFALSRLDLSRPIWIEDESRMIGRCKIPDPLFQRIQESPLFCIECPIEERLERLACEYGQTDISLLVFATKSLSKRLGGSRTQEAISLILEGRLQEAIALTLHYYDASYQYSLKKRLQPCSKMQGDHLTPDEWAKRLILAAKVDHAEQKAS